MKELQHIKYYAVVERKDKLNDENLKEIRYILEGVKSGKLLHNQRAYHTITSCGTAHCIAGWKCYLDATKAGLEIADYKESTDPCYCGSDSESIKNFILSELSQPLEGDCEWNYAETKWGLTPDEAWLLFDAGSSLEEQFELLEVLEAGYTIKDKDDD